MNDDKNTPIDEEFTDGPDDLDGGDDNAAVHDEVAKIQAERDTLFEKLARTQADYQNSRRRLETEFDQRLQYANSALIRSLLPVVDNWERALAVDPATTDVSTVLKGLGVVHDQMMSVLNQQQVEVIAPDPGTPFDPGIHEGLMQQPDDRYSEPTVTQLLQKGYRMAGRVLRPAQVAVSQTR